MKTNTGSAKRFSLRDVKATAARYGALVQDNGAWIDVYAPDNCAWYLTDSRLLRGRYHSKLKEDPKLDKSDVCEILVRQMKCGLFDARINNTQS